jgi:nucleotide-binding universal stress UspA family protein
MSVRTILVPIRGDGKGEDVLDHALALARPFNAHLQVIHCRPRSEDMLPYGVYVPTAFRNQVTSWATGIADDEEVKLRALFKEYCSRHELVVVEDSAAAPKDRVSASWEEATGKQAAVVALRGRLADVIAVPRPDRDLNLGHNTLEAALLETGRPVLLCPPVQAGTIGRHVAIGWNGSPEAARAVAAALPVLTAAERVTVLTATTGTRTELGPEDLRRHLTSHGCEAEIRTFRSRATEVGHGLLATAEEIGTDTLLIGAYGHSRRRELLMGGVTQHVIDHADMPVLLVH